MRSSEDIVSESGLFPREGPKAAGVRALPGRWKRWINCLSTFVLGQGAVQVLNLIAGFLLIRWLSVGDYAVYSLATGFQGTVGVLVEMGLGGSIVALLAGRTDPAVVGSYIRSTRHYRNRIFLLLLPAVSIAFPLIALRQDWGWTLTAALLAVVIGTLYFQSLVTYYSVPLLVHQSLGVYYRTPAALGAARLALYFLLHLVSFLSASLAVCVNSLAIVIQGVFYKRHSAPYVAEPSAADPAINREVLGYIRPLIPSTIFFAFQGQISILLISWFGQARNIAEVGALGRIGQAFVMLSAFNSVVISPFIARTPGSLLLRRYLQVFAGAAGLSAAIAGAGFLLPGPFLWLLGSKYSHLGNELGWMMLSSCLAYISSVMWTIHSARKWIFHWGVWAYIGGVVLTQIAGLLWMDLGTTRNVILFSVYSTLATTVIQGAWAVAGFIWERRGQPSAETSRIS